MCGFRAALAEALASFCSLHCWTSSPVSPGNCLLGIQKTAWQSRHKPKRAIPKNKRPHRAKIRGPPVLKMQKQLGPIPDRSFSVQPPPRTALTRRAFLPRLVAEPALPPHSLHWLRLQIEKDERGDAPFHAPLFQMAWSSGQNRGQTAETRCTNSPEKMPT